jgi:hypothetical protein
VITEKAFTSNLRRVNFPSFFRRYSLNHRPDPHNRLKIHFSVNNMNQIIGAYLLATTMLTFYVTLTKYDILKATIFKNVISSLAIGILFGWLIWPLMLIKLFPEQDPE